MKILLLPAIILGFCLIQPSLQADTPEFQAWEYITANGSPITLSIGHAAPCVIDWDGDGLKDLLLGQYSSGKIRFYRNVGRKLAPAFTTYSYLQADGKDIAVSYG